MSMADPTFLSGRPCACSISLMLGTSMKRPSFPLSKQLPFWSQRRWDVRYQRANLNIIARTAIMRVVFSDRLDNGNHVVSEVQFSTGPQVQYATIEQGGVAFLECGTDTRSRPTF
ncbi:hypothetical protein CVT26_005500 [Gymnopilus dilepis]|uniref:Uncharacterized protein n=1 Tax=Gymnopilus dilepis TaxID=231916 RepID=A0A409WJJ3_9AGAR|nr:hypothetical protein CVT26_005500 [Gymnopilus dilepis]